LERRKEAELPESTTRKERDLSRGVGCGDEETWRKEGVVPLLGYYMSGWKNQEELWETNMFGRRGGIDTLLPTPGGSEDGRGVR